MEFRRAALLATEPGSIDIGHLKAASAWIGQHVSSEQKALDIMSGATDGMRDRKA